MKYFKRFGKIDGEYLMTDRHIHTDWTDGKNSIEEMLSASLSAGLVSIAFTDHIRSDSSYFDAYLRKVRNVDLSFPVEVLSGFEAKIADLDGNLDVPPEVMKRADIRVGSVHRFPLDGYLREPASLGREKCQETELKLTLAAVKKGSFNVLGHPGGMSLRSFGDFPEEFFDEIIKLCADKNIAFELNSSYHVPVYGKFKAALKKHDPYISLGSDAHSREELVNSIRWFKGVFADV